MKKRYIIGIIILFVVLIVVILYRDQKVAVLGYHSFITEESYEQEAEHDPLVLKIDHFEKQLAYLHKHGYKTLSLEEFYCYHQKKCKIPRKSVLITMDDGYQSNYELALPLLKKYKMKAVIFLVGSNIKNKLPNYLTEEMITTIKKEYPDLQLASHSYRLHERGAIKRPKKEITEDFEQMKEVTSVPFFAYPYGDHNEQIEEILKEQHYKMAFTFGPGKEHRLASRKDPVYEIPRLNISNDMPLWKFVLRLKMFY